MGSGSRSNQDSAFVNDCSGLTDQQSQVRVTDCESCAPKCLRITMAGLSFQQHLGMGDPTLQLLDFLAQVRSSDVVCGACHGQSL